MNLELQAELIRRYPKSFRKLGRRRVASKIIADFEAGLQDDREPFDGRGVECGDGWFAIIDRLSGACENEIETLISLGFGRGRPRVA